MKFQIASDLHLEQFHWQRMHIGFDPAPDADVLVLAGDIAKGTDAVERFQSWPVPVIYITGNHEFYDGVEMDETIAKLRSVCAGTNVHFLERNALVLPAFPDVRILGTCMWTDYKLFGNAKEIFAMLDCQRALNDHRLIRAQGSRFLAEDAQKRHAWSRQWLEEQLSRPFDGKTVVVSHHGCHWNSVAARYFDDLVTAGFSSDLTDLLAHADLWIHGHTHDGFDYQVGRAHVVCNPRGYHYGGNDYENEAFDKQKVVEV